MSTATKAPDPIASTRRASESSWLDRTARLGFVTRAIVYAIVAGLAVRMALGERNDHEANKHGALQAIADQPLGRFVLAVLAVGLGGYALWRLSEAALGYRNEDNDAKRTAKRLASAGKAAIYFAFCASAVAVIAGRSTGNSEQQQKEWTARVLDWPGGQLLVGLTGLAIAAGGVYLIVRGVRTKFEKQLDTGRMSPGMKRASTVVGMVGSVGRGVVFGLLGVLLIDAAIDYDPNKARGIDGTLRTIAAQTFGQVLLLLTALALFAFAAYSLVEARYRRL